MRFFNSTLVYYLLSSFSFRAYDIFLWASTALKFSVLSFLRKG